jgi:hypothetical protein
VPSKASYRQHSTDIGYYIMDKHNMNNNNLVSLFNKKETKLHVGYLGGESLCSSRMSVVGSDERFAHQLRTKH